MTMRIGIDCRTMLDPGRGEGAGVGHYVHHLVESLLEEDDANEYVLFFDDHEAAGAKRHLAAGRKNVAVRFLPFRSMRRHLPFVYAHVIVSAAFERAKLDLLHGPANATPIFYRGRTVVTVHDLAIYDHPEWFPARLPGARTFSTRIVVPNAAAKASRVIAVSATTKKDIIRILGTPEGKIDVVYEGVEPPPRGDAASTLRRFGVRPREYVLFLGTLEPRKNVVSAVRAFAHAMGRGWLPPTTEFLVAGAHGWKERPTIEAIAAANAELAPIAKGTKEPIRRVGYVTAEEKRALLAGAGAFVFPSLYEGFGLPALEAMAAGAPVIASTAASLPEVCGDAALLVDPRDEEGIAHALRTVFGDHGEADRLRALGRDRSAEFTWRRTARETLAVYRRVVEGG